MRWAGTWHHHPRLLVRYFGQEEAGCGCGRAEDEYARHVQDSAPQLVQLLRVLAALWFGGQSLREESHGPAQAFLVSGNYAAAAALQSLARLLCWNRRLLQCSGHWDADLRTMSSDMVPSRSAEVNICQSIVADVSTPEEAVVPSRSVGGPRLARRGSKRCRRRWPQWGHVPKFEPCVLRSMYSRGWCCAGARRGFAACPSWPARTSAAELLSRAKRVCLRQAGSVRISFGGHLPELLRGRHPGPCALAKLGRDFGGLLVRAAVTWAQDTRHFAHASASEPCGTHRARPRSKLIQAYWSQRQRPLNLEAVLRCLLEEARRRWRRTDSWLASGLYARTSSFSLQIRAIPWTLISNYCSDHSFPAAHPCLKWTSKRA